MNEWTIARQAIAHRGKLLEYFTIVWNFLEGLVAIAAGAIAGSISLVGFGIDSFIEVTSGATLLWRMAVDSDVQSRERNEKLSLRIVGVWVIGCKFQGDRRASRPKRFSFATPTTFGAAFNTFGFDPCQKRLLGPLTQ